MSILSLPHYSLLLTDRIRELGKGLPPFPLLPYPEGMRKAEEEEMSSFSRLPHIFQSFYNI
jgi:hypothetical protein